MVMIVICDYGDNTHIHIMSHTIHHDLSRKVDCMPMSQGTGAILLSHGAPCFDFEKVIIIVITIKVPPCNDYHNDDPTLVMTVYDLYYQS